MGSVWAEFFIACQRGELGSAEVGLVMTISIKVNFLIEAT